MYKICQLWRALQQNLCWTGKAEAAMPHHFPAWLLTQLKAGSNHSQVYMPENRWTIVSHPQKQSQEKGWSESFHGTNHEMLSAPAYWFAFG